MSEIRWGPIKQKWVIIAAERSLRPDDFITREEPIREPKSCPFDYGNEGITPPEIFAIRTDGSRANSPGWKVRVVSNKFPALRIEGEMKREGVGLYDYMSGIGAHEVVIETPEHKKRIHDMTVDEIKLVFYAWQERMKDLAKDNRFKYIQIFKNHGAQAGASLAHSHSQIIATPIIPSTVTNELIPCKEHFSKKERCLFCDVLKDEILRGDRIVLLTDFFVVFCPYDSFFPFEMWILPREHNHDFTTLNSDGLYQLSITLKDVLTKLLNLLNDPPLNIVLHTSPIQRLSPSHPDYWRTLVQDYHWHIELIPRLTRIAGFEWGTGYYINPTFPEESARLLRDV